jgi:hypothetical protein
VHSAGGDTGSPGTYVAVPCNVPLGFNYCAALPNPSGTTASLSALGSAAASAQNVTLTVQGANPSMQGLFLFGHTAVQMPFSHGNLCVGGGIQRMPPAVVTDASGARSFAIDFNAPYAAAITAGAALYFQFWYRDQGGSNLSDGLRIDFH